MTRSINVTVNLNTIPFDTYMLEQKDELLGYIQNELQCVYFCADITVKEGEETKLEIISTKTAKDDEEQKGLIMNMVCDICAKYHKCRFENFMREDLSEIQKKEYDEFFKN